jgi:tetratricopeptide (TPR) repeat protein
MRFLAAWLVVSAGAAAAQTPVDFIAAGDSLAARFDLAAALQRYESAARADSTSALAWWKAAGAAIDVAKQLTDERDRARRDSLYLVARSHAERAITRDSLDAAAHFMLAQALGRLSRTKGGKERVRYGRLIYDEAARALRLNPHHDGAHHVLGAWHAEVKRLSGFTRTFAKLFLGGGFLGRAHWDSAIVHLERAVELRPAYVFHRLELAQIYVDRNRRRDAARQLEEILALPSTDVLDERHKEEAARLLARIGPTP